MVCTDKKRQEKRAKKRAHLKQREWTVAMALHKPALGWRIDQHGDMLAYFAANEFALLLKARIAYHVSKYATAQLKKERERRVALAKSQVEHHRSQERARQERASAEGKEFVPNDSDVYIPAPASLDGSTLKQQDYVDNALHVTAVNGSPSFLITMTLDVNHPDITENLGEGQTANTRPDVTAMVAHRAFERLLYFVHGGMLGVNLTTTATVEWQARGLPHLHLIVTNERQDRVLQAADADHFTTCEAPDNNDELLNLVAKFMQHKHKAGECCEAEDLDEKTGELHDKNARCKQGFPRPLAAYTHEVDEGGELLLRCRGRRVDAPVSANNATERNPFSWPSRTASARRRGSWGRRTRAARRRSEGAGPDGGESADRRYSSYTTGTHARAGWQHTGAGRTWAARRGEVGRGLSPGTLLAHAESLRRSSQRGP